jgi:serine/threonine-protein kinase SRPK3
MDHEEDHKDYVRGGYHPVRTGDVFSGGRYTIVRKLGWGHFATVWLANDQRCAIPCLSAKLQFNLSHRTDRHVALKVVKSARRYTEAALDEIEFLQRLTLSPAPELSTHPGRSHIISFLDHFRHTGPNGTHICMVFEVLGENLLGLIRRHHGRGVPIGVVKQIAKQVLLGLDYVHRCCRIIHAGEYDSLKHDPSLTSRQT